MLTAKPPNPRTYRIVGPQRRIDERETPHPRTDRGELGERLRLWRKTRSEGGALMRIVGDAGDLKEVRINPPRTSVPDPADMARKIKEAARFFGATLVGITHL